MADNLATRSTVALVGKLPNHADFVRAGAMSHLGQKFFRWLSEATQHAASVGRPGLLLRPVAFVVPDADGSCLVGVMVPSRDQIGRAFPLTVLRSQGDSRWSGAYAGIPIAVEFWTSRASDVLSQLSTEGASQENLEGVLADLAADTNATEDMRSERLDSVAEGWAQETQIQELHAWLFPEDPENAPFYAYQALRLACGRAPAATEEVFAGIDATIVTDCPIRTVKDTFVWLTLAKHLLSTATLVPSFFWTLPQGATDTDQRLLISLGSPPVELCAYLSGAHAKSPRFWPLSIRNQTALLKRTREQFPPSLIELAQTSTVADFMKALVAALQATG